jgi:hypothetical protein
VNGDVQRGKSTMEAFQALIVKHVNDSAACRDRCFSVLGTQMVPWAADVANKMQRAAIGPSAAGAAAEDEAEDDEIDTADLAADVCNLFTVTSICAPAKTSWKEHLKALRATMEQGGCIVFSRTAIRMDKVTSLVFQFVNEQHAAGLSVSSHFVILDEADRMRGTGAGEGQYLFEYEAALGELCGDAPVQRRNRKDVDVPADAPHEWFRLRSAMVSDVSATNGLCFFAMLQRLGARTHKVMDVLSFQDDPQNYIGYADCTPHRSRLLEDLTRANNYMNEDVLDVYHEVLTTDWACVLDCTTTTVNCGTPGNQQVHAASVVAALAACPVRGAALATRGMVFVFVHGGGTTFPGNVGLHFAGAGAAVRVGELRASLRQHNKELNTFRLNDCGTGEYLTQEMLRPLLQALDDEQAEPNRVMREKLNLEQLSLTLLLLRTRWPGLPVAVVGYGMVRRSLSIVAVNAEKQCVLAVTHEIQWATPSSNAADVTQQARLATHARARTRPSRPCCRSVPLTAVAMHSAVLALLHHAAPLPHVTRL